MALEEIAIKYDSFSPRSFSSHPIRSQWIKITDTATGHVAYGQVRDECPRCDGAYSLGRRCLIHKEYITHGI